MRPHTEQLPRPAAALVVPIRVYPPWPQLGLTTPTYRPDPSKSRLTLISVVDFYAAPHTPEAR